MPAWPTEMNQPGLPVLKSPQHAGVKNTPSRTGISDALRVTVRDALVLVLKYGILTIAEQRARADMKILIVDDHVLIREALRGVLKELNEDAVIIEAPDGRQ